MTKKRNILIAATAALALGSQAASAVDITLFEYAFNIDGTASNITLGDALPTEVDTSAFDTSTGLGAITVTLTGVGAHYASLFVDHEIDETTNTFYNDLGSVTGTAATGLSWEIDEPGYVSGDIYENFVAGFLDNGIGTSVYGATTFPDDVSMALAWDFNLAPDEDAVISFLLSTTAPTSGLYLTQTDPDSQASIYFSSSLRFEGTAPPPPAPAPVPATIALLGLGLVGLGFARRREG